MKQIILTKLLIYVPFSSILFYSGFILTVIASMLLFDTSDPLQLDWVLWGIFLELVSVFFYVSLMLFTSSVFRGTVASVLLTLAMFIGVPLIGTTLITVELLMRGLMDTPPVEWENVSYVGRTLLWWPAALSDTQAFLTVTESEVNSGMISFFGQAFELDAHFRSKPLISTLISSPILALLAWRRYTRREI